MLLLLSDKKGRHINRLCAAAREAYLAGDSTTSLEAREASAAAVQKEAIIRKFMTRAAKDHQASLKIANYAEYEKYMNEIDPVTGEKREIPEEFRTSLPKAAVGSSSSGSGHKRKRGSSSTGGASKKGRSSTHSSSSAAETSSSVPRDSSHLLYSDTEVAQLTADVNCLKLGRWTSLPTDGDQFKRVQDVNAECANVFGCSLQRNTMAEREYACGEKIIVNWEAVKLKKSELLHPPADSYFLGNGVFIRHPDHGSNPNFPFSYVMCAPGMPEDQCNLRLMDNSSLLVVKHIDMYSTMLAYCPPNKSEKELTCLCDFAVLRLITSMILEWELKAWQLVRYGHIVGKNDVRLKFPDPNVIDQAALRVMKSQALIGNVLALVDQKQLTAFLETIVSFDHETFTVSPLSKGVDTSTTVASLATRVDTSATVASAATGDDTSATVASAATGDDTSTTVASAATGAGTSATVASVSPVDTSCGALTVDDCIFLAECYTMFESSYVGFDEASCCDKTWNVNQLTLAQRYLWFVRLQEWCFDTRNNGGIPLMAPTLNMADVLVQRQCDFLVAGRCFFPLKPASEEKSFQTYEFQYTDALPTDFETRRLDDIPERPVVSQEKVEEEAADELEELETLVDDEEEEEDDEKSEEAGERRSKRVRRSKLEQQAYQEMEKLKAALTSKKAELESAKRKRESAMKRHASASKDKYIESINERMATLLSEIVAMESSIHEV
jgi:hypothetical protein